MLGRYYFVRQASTLLRFAKSTSDQKLAATLVAKAADLRAQAEPLPDTSPAPPDVESAPDEQLCHKREP